MGFEVLHNVKNGVRQLLEAPHDLAHIVPNQGTVKLKSHATQAHQDLFSKYLQDFAVAYEIGDDWWEGCVSAMMQDGHTIKEANELAFENRLAGPTSAPQVVWFFRKYWLDFDGLNRELSFEHRVPPQVALLGWLVDDGLDEYVRFLTCMPYWPIGLDKNGNWC